MNAHVYEHRCREEEEEEEEEQEEEETGSEMSLPW
jgi:hypothetical protein